MQESGSELASESRATWGGGSGGTRTRSHPKTRTEDEWRLTLIRPSGLFCPLISNGASTGGGLEGGPGSPWDGGGARGAPPAGLRRPAEPVLRKEEGGVVQEEEEEHSKSASVPR